MYDNIVGRMLVIDYNTIMYTDAVLCAMIMDKLITDKDHRLEATYPDSMRMAKLGYKRIMRDGLMHLFHFKEEEFISVYESFRQEYSPDVSLYSVFRTPLYDLSQEIPHDILIPKIPNVEPIFEEIQKMDLDMYSVFVLDTPELMLKICKTDLNLKGRYFLFPNHAYNEKYYRENEQEILTLASEKEFLFSVAEIPPLL